MNDSSRKIGLLGAISIGIGGMVGGGIFAVLGEAVSLAHSATAIAFLLAGLVALLTAYSYAKLSVCYQNSAGTVVFITNAFGNNLFSSAINIMLWLSYLVTISLYATAFASYGATFFTNTSSLLHHILISLAIILPAVLNLISSKIVTQSETTIVVIKLALLALVIVSGIPYIDTTRLALPSLNQGLGVITAGMIIFVAYEGFELIANSAQEIKNPTINLPRAFYASVIIVILLYILISLVVVGTVNESQLLEAKEYALALAAKPALGEIGFSLVAIAALLSTFSAINATIYGNARLGVFLAKERELPKKLQHVQRDIPDIGVVVTTILSLIIANSISLSEIAIIASAGFLLIFALVNLAAFKLRAIIKAKASIVLSAFIMSSLALFTLLIYTFKYNPHAIIIFISFIAIAFLFEFFFSRIFGVSPA
ncbi:amino acid permease [Sulfurimonas sp. SAG-AH-194-I05]|nr:APC family permease [Sulfurimonas sp. SAG-AH-194-I05]MDF1874357.1 amino acid permease [Sulfurimonas sp. SAG-AH-194-I05]